jgi:hypothetical protein
MGKMVQQVLIRRATHLEQAAAPPCRANLRAAALDGLQVILDGRGTSELAECIFAIRLDSVRLDYS